MQEWWAGFAAGTLAAALWPPLLWLLCVRLERAEPGSALVVLTRSGRRVAFRARLRWPGEKALRVDLRPQRFDISLLGDGAARTRDGRLVDVVACVALRIPARAEDVLQVLDRMGAERAGDVKVLQDLYAAPFEQALHAVASGFTGDEVYARRIEFRDRVMELVAPQLQGYQIDSLAISTLQKLPLRAAAASAQVSAASGPRPD
jgi:uncharacterized membrane protein YqiK